MRIYGSHGCYVTWPHPYIRTRRGNRDIRIIWMSEIIKKLDAEFRHFFRGISWQFGDAEREVACQTGGETDVKWRVRRAERQT